MLGNTASVYYLSASLSTQDIASASDEISASEGSYDIFVYFDTVACNNAASGKLVYVERDGAGEVVRTASVNNVYVQNDNNVSTTVNLVTGLAQTATFPGAVVLPPALGDATIIPVMSFDGALAPLDTVIVSAAAPDFTVEVPVIADVHLRLGGRNQPTYRVRNRRHRRHLVGYEQRTVVDPAAATTARTACGRWVVPVGGRRLGG